MKIGSATLTDQRTRSKPGSMRAPSQNRKSLHAAALEVLALYLGHFSELKLKADQSCSRGAPIAQLLGNSTCPPKWYTAPPLHTLLLIDKHMMIVHLRKTDNFCGHLHEGHTINA